jgi:hypothetical protein
MNPFSRLTTLLMVFALPLACYAHVAPRHPAQLHPAQPVQAVEIPEAHQVPDQHRPIIAEPPVSVPEPDLAHRPYNAPEQFVAHRPNLHALKLS